MKKNVVITEFFFHVHFAGPTVFLLGRGSSLEIAREVGEGPVRGMFRWPGQNTEVTLHYL